jgi:hypothetical protein
VSSEATTNHQQPLLSSYHYYYYYYYHHNYNYYYHYLAVMCQITIGRPCVQVTFWRLRGTSYNKLIGV